jgi:hypothetical protein
MSDNMSSSDRLSDHELAQAFASHQELRSNAFAASPVGRQYICLMHPDVQSHHAGICPKCGMSAKRLSRW